MKRKVEMTMAQWEAVCRVISRADDSKWSKDYKRLVSTAHTEIVKQLGFSPCSACGSSEGTFLDEIGNERCVDCGMH